MAKLLRICLIGRQIRNLRCQFVQKQPSDSCFGYGVGILFFQLIGYTQCYNSGTYLSICIYHLIYPSILFPISYSTIIQFCGYKVPARPRCYKVSISICFFLCYKFPISTDILSLTAHFLISSFLCLIPKQPTLKTMSILLFSPFRCQRFLWSTKIATDTSIGFCCLFQLYSREEKPQVHVCWGLCKVFMFIPSHANLCQVLIIFMFISPFSLASLVLGSPGWGTLANCSWTFYSSLQWLQFSLQVQF